LRAPWRASLAKILERFIAKELQPYQRAFDESFYKEVFRLRGWAYGEFGRDNKRPMLMARITKDTVYARLAPGVLPELLRVSPRYENGRLKQPLHQRLTETFGHPKMREHIAAVNALMAISPDWETYMAYLDRAKPKLHANLSFDFMAPAKESLPGVKS
jgi:hypothetical protein